MNKKQTTRTTLEYVDLCEPYIIKERSFELQYYKYYNARYQRMFEWTKAVAVSKWGSDIKLIKLNELMDNQGVKVCVVGCLLKIMKLQPSVLHEVSDDMQLVPQPTLEKYINEEDKVSLQDGNESVILQGMGNVDELVTGVMVAVIGQETNNGNKFIVEDFCFPEFPPQKPFTLPSEDKFVVLVSGLGISLNPSKELVSARDMFVDFITGNYASDIAPKIARLIIAGNIMGKDARDQEKEAHREEIENNPDWGNGQERCFTLDTSKLIDEFLESIGKHIEVDFMPGSHDITSNLLPQQPLHNCVIPRSSQVKSIHCTTNPYCTLLDGLKFMGTSGRAVDSIREMSKYDDTLEILEKTLYWRHMIPTAPDVTYCYPYSDKDPFVLDDCPVIYFAGNQKEFGSKIFKGEDGQQVCLISVPNFEQKQTCVLLNLRNLNCELLAFG